MRLIYWLISSFLSGYLCSVSSNFDSKKRKLVSSSSSSNLDEDIEEKIVVENSTSDKRQKNDTMAELESFIEKGSSYCFITALKKKEKDCHLMHPDNSSLLELIIRKGDKTIIDQLFSSVCK